MSRVGREVKRQGTQEMVLDPQRRVKKLAEAGSSVNVNKTFAVKRYFRSGSEMERQARVYYTEGQLDKAFILYNKFVTLFVEKLPRQYPDYNKPEYKEDRHKIKRLLKEAFPRAEELKRKLMSQYEAEKQALEGKLAEEERARRKVEEEKGVAEQRQVREEAERRSQEEAERVAAFLAGTTQDTPTEQQQQQQEEEEEGNSARSEPTGGGTGDGGGDTGIETCWTQTVESVAPGDDQQQQQLASTMGALTIEEPYEAGGPPGERSVTATNAQLAQVLPPSYEGPPIDQQVTVQQSSSQPGTHLAAPGHTGDVPISNARTYRSIFSGPIPPADQTPPPNYSDIPPPTNPYYSSAGGQGAQIPPAVDPRMQQYYQYYGGHYQGVPHPAVPYVAQFSTASSSSWGSVELPTPSYHMNPQATPTEAIQENEDESSSPNIPPVDRSTKPTYNALSTSIGGGYRTVCVPESLSRRFQEFASSNTRQNIETCAILAGKLSRNQLHITHVILPKQRGGPDSCETLSEEELFDIQDQHDLITLGWIHTHPSQSAFMSSVDLHTHCSYQIMMDEAIAIVCAPRFSQVGVYMLTEPYGLDYITHCEAEGFHTHPKEPPIYEECSHVIFSKSPVEIVDLR